MVRMWVFTRVMDSNGMDACETEWVSGVEVSKSDIAVHNRNHLTATANHVLYVITQCYLQAGSCDFPVITPAKAGTQFSDPRGM